MSLYEVSTAFKLWFISFSITNLLFKTKTEVLSHYTHPVLVNTFRNWIRKLSPSCNIPWFFISNYWIFSKEKMPARNYNFKRKTWSATLHLGEKSVYTEFTEPLMPVKAISSLHLQENTSAYTSTSIPIWVWSVSSSAK